MRLLSDDKIVCPKCGEWWDIEPIDVIMEFFCVYEIFKCLNCGHIWVETHP